MERPKLYNTISLKSYPEEYQNLRTSYRHKNSSFETTTPTTRRNLQKDVKKHPIYVHNLKQKPSPPPFFIPEGDFIRTDKSKKTTNNNNTNNRKVSSVIDKLEEVYWANWKPNKSAKLPPKKSKEIKKELTVIKGPPKINNKNKTKNPISTKNITNNKKSIEVQTEIIENVQVKIESKKQENPKKINVIKTKSDDIERKFLKHTDSMILHAKNQNNKDKQQHVEQPQTIKLHKKPTTLKTYNKGGSYPLKSSLKANNLTTTTTTTTTNRGNIRLGRPGSPLIVSSSFATKNTKQYRK